MRTDCITNTNFQGRVIVTNKFSNKPRQCLNSSQKELESLVKDNNYIICVSQDYSTNTINFELKKSYQTNFDKKEEIVDTGIINKININSKASKYIEAAKKIISDHKALQEQKWEKEQTKKEWEELGQLTEAMVFMPIIFLVGGVCEGFKDISKDIKTMFNKAKKFAIKKG